MHLKYFFNRIRYNLSQILYPHECPVQPVYLINLVGGPADGKRVTSIISHRLHIPVVKKVEVKALTEDSILDSYLDSHPEDFTIALYELSTIRYNYVEPK